MPVFDGIKYAVPVHDPKVAKIEPTAHKDQHAKEQELVTRQHALTWQHRRAPSQALSQVTGVVGSGSSTIVRRVYHCRRYSLDRVLPLAPNQRHEYGTQRAWAGRTTARTARPRATTQTKKVILGRQVDRVPEADSTQWA
ncbi:hypothetical protein BCR44DRAFT_1433130 [Catenaria anguillulae PL171]|uniref:Uncharacterized protein n=1 Tax=Catenaria anguillulae PL171 TaxID=765915 RepID=A0A1Y2HNV8_9FUNG|nr:hypothetical protein BCR44DRAFT_1433130 [Catenaria anguillulae PL171]